VREGGERGRRGGGERGEKIEGRGERRQRRKISEKYYLCKSKYE
jgi:hypothetical protein